MNIKTRLSRRQFIKSNALAALAASVFPTIIPSSALGRDGAVAPSERVTVGAIGVGDRGRQVLTHFLQQRECQVVALCDLKRNTLARGKQLVDEKYQNADCRPLHDYRELVARNDVDAIMIASPDHWHVLHALAAVRAGKDIYLEKPMGLSLAQDQALRKEVLRRKRVFQFGTQQRSDKKFRLACELVRNGHVGELKHINIWAQGSRAGGATAPITPPPDLDFDFWLGPAPQRPFTENLIADGFGKNWWYVSDFALGFIAGWGIHPMDIALWGAGERASGTVEVQGRGRIPTEGICDTAVSWEVDFAFSTGLTMKFVSTPNGPGEKFEREEEWKARYRGAADHGTAFEGVNGWIRVHRGNIEANPEELLEISADSFATKLVSSSDHVRNFIESVKSRQPTVAPIESAVQSDAYCHVADIAIRLGRKLRYDAKAEKFIGDKEANQRLLVRPMRKPWKL